MPARAGAVRWRINFKMLSSSFAILELYTYFQASALPQTTMAADLMAPPSGRDSIARIEHSGEYLARAGVVAVPYIGQIGVSKVAGNWSFDLKDEKSGPAGTFMLCIFQSGSALFGCGTLNCWLGT